MSSSLPSLRSASIRDSAVDALRKALLEGRFQAGESISEPAVAAEMGVSRGPVREALLILQQEGLVVHHQNRGFEVLTVTPEDRRAMVEVRVPLEALALRLAQARAGKSDLLELDKLVDRMVKCYGSDTRSSAVDDLAFHEKLWDLSGNPWLVSALKRIALPFFMITIMYRNTNERLDAETYERQHRSYVEFLRGNSTVSAEDCVMQHLRLYQVA